MKYLEDKDGVEVPFRKIADRRKLIGKWIVYLRSTDIDRSGRGLYFPRYGFVEDCVNREIILDSTTVLVGDIVELRVRHA